MQACRVNVSISNAASVVNFTQKSVHTTSSSVCIYPSHPTDQRHMGGGIAPPNNLCSGTDGSAKAISDISAYLHNRASFGYIREMQYAYTVSGGADRMISPAIYSVSSLAGVASGTLCLCSLNMQLQTKGPHHLENSGKLWIASR